MGSRVVLLKGRDTKGRKRGLVCKGGTARARARARPQNSPLTWPTYIYQHKRIASHDNLEESKYSQSTYMAMTNSPLRMPTSHPLYFATCILCSPPLGSKVKS